MGPTILFDKSAVQSLGGDAIRIINEYFYTVIPHVLLMEVLADLSLDASDLTASSKRVQQLAQKLLPLDSRVNLNYNTLCLANLLGHVVPMNSRVPIVAGGQRVETADGQKGVFFDLQSEDEAVVRWYQGRFDSNDLKVALDWRENAKGANLEAERNALPAPPFPIRALQDADQFATSVVTFSDPEFVLPLLDWFLGQIQCDQETRLQILQRWRDLGCPSLQTFAPYAAHCVRVRFLFGLGIIHGLCSTRSSNIVDIEYFYYTPFAQIFCSGDKLHQQLAPFLLDSDQLFVTRNEMREAAMRVVEARATDSKAEPIEDSLISALWMKYNGRLPRRQQMSMTVDQLRALMERVEPILETLQKQAGQKPPPRYPV